MVPEQLAYFFDDARHKMIMISAETSFVGVLGHPISHSLSPIIHNAALKEMNLNWCYLAMPCEAKNLEVSLKGLRTINCKGLNITIPHKTKVLQHCSEISSIAQKVNAVNTLIPNQAGGWSGENTDVKGFLAPLQKRQKSNYKRAIIIGAGGAAKAVIEALKELGIESITIINRSNHSIENLLTNGISDDNDKSNNITIKGLLFNDLSIIEHIKYSDIIINTTPIGMFSNASQNKDYKVPLGPKIWDALIPGTTLYDLIYNPKPTQWLKIGLQKDCDIIDGLEMLIEQGAASLRLWSGIQDIPLNLMRNAAENYFSEIN